MLIISVARKLNLGRIYTTVFQTKSYYLSILNVPISRNWKKNRNGNRKTHLCACAWRARTLCAHMWPVQQYIARLGSGSAGGRAAHVCAAAGLRRVRRLVALRRRDFSLPSAIHEQLHRVARSTLRHTKYSKSKQGFQKHRKIFNYR